MKRTLSILGSLLLVSSFAYAQSPTDYTITHHPASNPDATSITTPYTFPITSPALTCDLSPTVVVIGTVVNPRFYRWDDPNKPGRECQFDKTLATTPLFTDPPNGGDYVARISATSKVGTATLTSDLSLPSNPFVRGTIPPVVLRLRVSK